MHKSFSRVRVLFALFWLGFFISAPSLPAQNLPITKFHRLNVDNGLSNNLVYNIVQDQQGFIWIATQHGLQRFDGQQFTLFLHDPSESNSVGGNDIRFLEIDKSGQLLIGYNDNKGLDKYDPASGIFTHQKLDSDLLQGLLTEAGDLWLWNLSGLQYKAKEDESFAIYNFSEHPKHRKDEAVRVKVIFEDQNKVIWVATRGGLYEIGKNATAGTWWLPCDERYISVDTTFSVNDVLKDKKGNFILWLGTYGGGMYRFDPNTEQFRHYGIKDGLLDELIEDLELDQNGYIWIAANDELYRFDPMNETFVNFGPDDGLPKTKFNSLSPAGSVSGQMYIAMEEGSPDSSLSGLFTILPKIGSIAHLASDDSPKLPSRFTLSATARQNRQCDPALRRKAFKPIQNETIPIDTFLCHCF